MKLKCYFEVYPGQKPEHIAFCNYPIVGIMSEGNKRYVAEIEIPDPDGEHIPVSNVKTQEVMPCKI